MHTDVRPSLVYPHVQQEQRWAGGDQYVPIQSSMFMNIMLQIHIGHCLKAFL